MLLDELTQSEKTAFWNIANLLAASDGRIDEEESILKQYSEEMGGTLEFVDPSSVDLDSELSGFSGSALRNRKIIYFELFGVAYADTDLHEKELSILAKVRSALGIDPETSGSLENIVKNIFDSYKALGDILNS